MTREFRAPDKGRLVSGEEIFSQGLLFLPCLRRSTSSTCHSILHHAWPLLLEFDLPLYYVARLFSSWIVRYTTDTSLHHGLRNRANGRRPRERDDSIVIDSSELIWNYGWWGPNVKTVYRYFCQELIRRAPSYFSPPIPFRGIRYFESRNSCEQNYHDSRLSPRSPLFVVSVGERRLIGIPLLGGLFHRSHGR